MCNLISGRDILKPYLDNFIESKTVIFFDMKNKIRNLTRIK